MERLRRGIRRAKGLALAAGGGVVGLLTSRSMVVVATTCAIFYGALMAVNEFHTKGPSGASRAGSEAATAAGSARARTAVNLIIRSGSRVWLWAVDTHGNEVGLNPVTGLARLGIAGASYSGKTVWPQAITIPNAAGTYHVRVVAVAGGAFRVSALVESRTAGVRLEKSYDGKLEAGEATDLAVRITFDGAGKPQLEVAALSGGGPAAGLPGQEGATPPGLVPKGFPGLPFPDVPWAAPISAATHGLTVARAPEAGRGAPPRGPEPAAGPKATVRAPAPTPGTAATAGSTLPGSDAAAASPPASGTSGSNAAAPGGSPASPAPAASGPRLGGAAADASNPGGTPAGEATGPSSAPKTGPSSPEVSPGAGEAASGSGAASTAPAAGAPAGASGEPSQNGGPSAAASVSASTAPAASAPAGASGQPSQNGGPSAAAPPGVSAQPTASGSSQPAAQPGASRRQRADRRRHREQAASRRADRNHPAASPAGRW